MQLSKSLIAECIGTFWLVLGAWCLAVVAVQYLQQRLYLMVQ
jgi:glycerol uptake facilitator-like aquaporin